MTQSYVLILLTSIGIFSHLTVETFASLHAQVGNNMKSLISGTMRGDSKAMEVSTS